MKPGFGRRIDGTELLKRLVDVRLLKSSQFNDFLRQGSEPVVDTPSLVFLDRLVAKDHSSSGGSSWKSSIPPVDDSELGSSGVVEGRALSPSGAGAAAAAGELIFLITAKSL